MRNLQKRAALTRYFLTLRKAKKLSLVTASSPGIGKHGLSHPRACPWQQSERLVIPCTGGAFCASMEPPALALGQL